jgi:peptide-methionine (S)-S-oxide reductase
MIFRRHDKTSSSTRAAATATAPPFAPPDVRGLERATFAAGCFWGVEAAFREIDGVVQISAGYTGGHTAAPTYEQVCGHAEAVEVWLDAAVVSYGGLLDRFWQIINPTTRIAKAWTSVISTALRSSSIRVSSTLRRCRLESASRPSIAGPSVTEIVAASAFYPAEEYYKRYLEKSGHAACAVTLRHAS